MGPVASGFVVIRTPLLPVDEFVAWGSGLAAFGLPPDAPALPEALESDRVLLRARLRALIDRPEVTEAVFVASPDLDAAASRWREDPTSERGRRAERSLVRYVSRAMTRATPFGLFAGCSVGAVGSSTRLELAARPSYQRHSRLDMEYLTSLSEYVAAQPPVREALCYRVNSSLYRAGGKVRYVEARPDGELRAHHLITIGETAHLMRVLEVARSGATLAQVTAALVADGFADIPAARFAERLVDRQVLVSDLEPALTGGEPLPDLMQRLRSLPNQQPVVDRLEIAGHFLASLDSGGLGQSPSAYRAVAETLGGIPVALRPGRLVQVDLVKPVVQATIGTAVVDEILQGVRLLQRISAPSAPTELDRFCEAVRLRYDDRVIQVALTELLDPETGIGFGSTVASSPLLHTIPTGEEAHAGEGWTPRDDVLLSRLLTAAALGATEIDLTPADIEAMASTADRELPSSFAVTAALAAASPEQLARGEFRVFLQSVDGPSGARLFGRFCHSDPNIARAVRDQLAVEESLDRDAVYAEIVHLPDSRMGNVLLRPVLRGWEIPYLGRSGAPVDRQIGVGDLRVSISGDRVHLFSVRLNRRVVPRLTSAHNHSDARNAPVYRFLCALQDQRRSSIAWSWGRLAEAPFLPRVRNDRVVLCPARWNVPGTELRALAATAGPTFEAVQRWRVARRLPRIVILVDEDNLLPIDLDNVLSVEMFVELVKRRPSVVLEEVFPAYDELPVESPEGHFVAELIVPFVQPREPAATTSLPRPVPASGEVRTRFPPGSEWLYVKLYGGYAGVDELLRDELGPLASRLAASGVVDRWFFIRYGDPAWHLRLRLHGDPARLSTYVLPELTALGSALMATGRILRLQLDTYEPELERYAGPAGMAASERIFHADSEAVLAMLRRLERGDAGLDERWRLAVVGVDRLLHAFGLDLAARRRLMQSLKTSFAAEHHADARTEKFLSQRFRAHRAELIGLLDVGEPPSGPLAPGVEILQRRTEQITSPVEELRAACDADGPGNRLSDLAASHAHMHVNRLLQSRHRANEMVIYDFLARLYGSGLARAGLR